VFHEFGSGVVLPTMGIAWQNRGIVFELDPDHPRALRAGRQPFHTLNPAMGEFDDGRLISYGTMGGEGQPQTQAAIITRMLAHGMAPQAAITAPRWLIGRTWGSASNTLKLEAGLGAAVIEELGRRGQPVEVVPDFSEMMGHAGAIQRRGDGMLEGGVDPRGDGLVAAF
jgi:gamma-glutamyltranspeptidase/glutathione hydrolase